MKEPNKEGFKSYTLKRKRGIDDLVSEFAFRGNSQGDESTSNNIQDYLNSEGWMSYVFIDFPLDFKDIDKDQKLIYEEVERRKKLNIAYVEELKIKGEYGKDFEYSIQIKHNPIFDSPKHPIIFKPLESYKMMFIDPETSKLTEWKKENS